MGRGGQAASVFVTPPCRQPAGRALGDLTAFALLVGTYQKKLGGLLASRAVDREGRAVGSGAVGHKRKAKMGFAAKEIGLRREKRASSAASHLTPPLTHYHLRSLRWTRSPHPQRKSSQTLTGPLLPLGP